MVKLGVVLLPVRRLMLIDTGLFSVVALSALRRQLMRRLRWLLMWFLMGTCVISSAVVLVACREQFRIDHVVGYNLGIKMGMPVNMLVIGARLALEVVHGGRKVESC